MYNPLRIRAIVNMTIMILAFCMYGQINADSTPPTKDSKMSNSDQNTNRNDTPSINLDFRSVTLELQGWNEISLEGEIRAWKDERGSALSFILVDSSGFPDLNNQDEIRNWCRSAAEENQGGLIEASVVETPIGTSISYIYKRRHGKAYTFLGMMILPMHDKLLVWTVVAQEQGTTGLRETAITMKLFKSGELNMEKYGELWARDPYDTSYHGVDKSLLRFISDDECYDQEFPNHPLTVVRKTLKQLPTAIRINANKP